MTDSRPTLGGLFSGIGGFELAWQNMGGRVAWMCEIDPKVRQVLTARFPGVPIYEDVTELDPSQVEAVDVLTGGSPCQGFSIAGARRGLEHGESRLFADYIRIMEGLAARGLQFALWENVPGVLSIKNDDGERTFEHVVSAFIGESEPVRLDPKHKWHVGMAVRSEEGSGGGRAVAWRILDSRYFGVAQRRRRIFACVAFGDSCGSRAGRALLAVTQGMQGYSDTIGTSGEAAAGTVGGSVATSGRLGVRKVRSDEFVPDDTGSTLAARDYKDYGDLVLEPQPFRKSRRVSGPDDYETWVDDGQANTLNTFDMGDVRTTHAVVQPVQNPAVLLTMREGAAGGGKGPLLSVEQSLTLQSINEQALFEPGETYDVRRLTPIECERLQGFPDGWTEPAGSDSARYKALGNAVTVNTVQWVLGRIRNAMEATPTLPGRNGNDGL